MRLKNRGQIFCFILNLAFASCGQKSASQLQAPLSAELTLQLNEDQRSQSNGSSLADIPKFPTEVTVPKKEAFSSNSSRPQKVTTNLKRISVAAEVSSTETLDLGKDGKAVLFQCKEMQPNQPISKVNKGNLRKWSGIQRLGNFDYKTACLTSLDTFPLIIAYDFAPPVNNPEAIEHESVQDPLAIVCRNALGTSWAEVMSLGDLDAGKACTQPREQPLAKCAAQTDTKDTEWTPIARPPFPDTDSTNCLGSLLLKVRWTTDQLRSHETSLYQGLPFLQKVQIVNHLLPEGTPLEVVDLNGIDNFPGLKDLSLQNFEVSQAGALAIGRNGLSSLLVRNVRLFR